VAASTLGIGMACADCARAGPGSAINIANTVTAPIHKVFI
jgi:hypothetical protein